MAVYAVLAIIKIKSSQESTSKCLLTKCANHLCLLKICATMLTLIFLSKEESHGLNVSLFVTQTNDSFANFRYFTEKMPKIAKTTAAIMQIIHKPF